MSTATTETMRSGFRTIDGVRIRYAELAEHARLVAVDLPGFGQSERREDLMSPRAMGDFLARLVDEAGLRAPHIVGPDVGTAAALFAADFLDARLPNGRLAVIDAGHFVWEEAPTDYAASVIDWMTAEGVAS
jgi:pimeloyl-ACP methyl ester carboxylesterase